MTGLPHLFEAYVLAEWTDYHVRGVIDTAELRVLHYRALVRHVQDDNLDDGYTYWIEGHLGNVVVEDRTLHATADDAKAAAVETLDYRLAYDNTQLHREYVERTMRHTPGSSWLPTLISPDESIAAFESFGKEAGPQ